MVITLTTMDDGWAVPLTNTTFGPSNTSHSQFLHDIGVWSKIAKHLWVWDCARRKHPSLVVLDTERLFGQQAVC